MPALGILKVSYQMGKKRGAEWQKVKEAAHIEVDMYDTRPDRRDEHKKAIKSLTGEDKE
jgi:hypothetical protein